MYVDNYCFLNQSSILLSETKEKLLQFCKVAYDVLKPGGKFVGIIPNPNTNSNEMFEQTKKYGTHFYTELGVCQDASKVR